MGSMLSSAYAAVCSFVKAQLDKVEMMQMMANDPRVRAMSAEEREDLRRWIRAEQDAEQDARSAAARLRGHHPKLRCNYRHPCYRVDAGKNKVAQNV